MHYPASQRRRPALGLCSFYGHHSVAWSGISSTASGVLLWSDVATTVDRRNDPAGKKTKKSAAPERMLTRYTNPEVQETIAQQVQTSASVDLQSRIAKEEMDRTYQYYQTFLETRGMTINREEDMYPENLDELGLLAKSSASCPSHISGLGPVKETQAVPRSMETSADD